MNQTADLDKISDSLAKLVPEEKLEPLKEVISHLVEVMRRPSPQPPPKPPSVRLRVGDLQEYVRAIEKLARTADEWRVQLNKLRGGLRVGAWADLSSRIGENGQGLDLERFDDADTKVQGIRDELARLTPQWDENLQLYEATRDALEREPGGLPPEVATLDDRRDESQRRWEAIAKARDEASRALQDARRNAYPDFDRAGIRAAQKAHAVPPVALGGEDPAEVTRSIADAMKAPRRGGS